MAKSSYIKQFLSQEGSGAPVVTVDDGVDFRNPDDAQDALDAAMHYVAECQDTHRETMQTLEELLMVHHALQLHHDYLLSLQGKEIPKEMYIAQECALEVVNDILGEYSVPVPSLEDYEESAAHASTSMYQRMAEGLARIKKIFFGFYQTMEDNLDHFFHGFQGVCNRTLNVLGEADRILDTGIDKPKASILSLEGAFARSLQAGKTVYTFDKAVDEVTATGRETVKRFLPEVVKYANDMSAAFLRSDLSKVTHGLGIDKKGFMALAEPFASVRAPIPPFCNIHGEKRYFFNLAKDDYRETLSSKPFPGDMVVEITHPMGNLQTLVDREDAKGFYANFPAWLTVHLEVNRANEAPKGAKIQVEVPSFSDLRSHLNKVRDLVREVRELSLKSGMYKEVSKKALDTYEQHFIKQMQNPVNMAFQAGYIGANAAAEVVKIGTLAKSIVSIARGGLAYGASKEAGRALTLHAADTAFDFAVLGFVERLGHLGWQSGRLLGDTIIELGGYYARELRDLASIGLRMAKQYNK